MTVPASAEYLAEGTRLLNRFTILREIGRGGFSVVYAATDDAVGGTVALKLLVPPPAVAQQAKERMRREVRAVRGLAHRHIVQVHDFVEDGPRSFVVMELIDGPDLAVRVREKGPLKADEAARIGAQIAEALSLAHAQGILHRDVKPSNILLASDGRACLADFGSAKLQGMVSMTQTGGLPGTLDFLAPELLAGSRADARADIYALGLTLHVAVTGQLPKRASQHLPPPATAEGHHPRALRADLPAWLDAIVARATTARPSDRFASADLLADALVAREAAVLSGAKVVPLSASRCPSCGVEDAGANGLCAACTLSRRWVPLPRSLYGIAAGMVVAGTAASVVAPPLLLLSPLLAAGTLIEGQRQARGRSRLPAAARRTVGKAMGELRPGVARRLLVDIVTASDTVYPSYRRIAGASAERDVTEFIGHACAAAKELAEVDELLATLEHGLEGASGVTSGQWSDAVALTERRRDALVQKLLGTMAALARMGSHASQAESNADQLGEMGRGLESAVKDHAEAMREVELALKASPALPG